VLEADYGVDCLDPLHRRFEVAAYVLVLLVPLGVPLAALAVLLRAHRAHRATFDAGGPRESTAGEGAAVAASAEAYAHARLEAQYGFLVADFRPGCYWFEPLDLVRKLALTSLLQARPPARPAVRPRPAGEAARGLTAARGSAVRRARHGDAGPLVRCGPRSHAAADPPPISAPLSHGLHRRAPGPVASASPLPRARAPARRPSRRGPGPAQRHHAGRGLAGGAAAPGAVPRGAY
jgi:hypothetical protein